MRGRVTNQSFPPAMRLTLAGLALERGGRRLVSGLSVALNAGEALVVTGPNGSGKTTLLRTICGLLRPLEGRILFAGAGEPGDSPALHCHYLGHLDGLKNAMTAAENLAFWSALLSRGGPAASPKAALERFGLAHALDLPVAYLSAGQKRRVALARLLCAPRPLWILDEPTNALDARSQARFSEILQEHVEQGGMAVVATHAAPPLARAIELRLGLASGSAPAGPRHAGEESVV